MQHLKPRARWLHPGNVMVTHPCPTDGWVAFDTTLDGALAMYYRCVLADMIKPVPCGTVVRSK